MQKYIESTITEIGYMYTYQDRIFVNLARQHATCTCTCTYNHHYFGMGPTCTLTVPGIQINSLNDCQAVLKHLAASNAVSC